VLLNSCIMSISLDRLYHYIENVAEEAHQDNVIIYRFFPHGSKNIEDLTYIKELQSTWHENKLYPGVWCNDQEPLNYDFYAKNLLKCKNKWSDLLDLIQEKTFFISKNLNYQRSIWDKGLLLHSEKRSPEVGKYEADKELIPVYYWSHAVIALDWFRYARHEKFQKSVKKIFLIYNRAWSGTREYRLKFTELLIQNNLVKHCHTTLNPQDPELRVHYKDHNFAEPRWKPGTVLENFFKPTLVEASSSADFVAKDYNTTEIEIVLETLFDDPRLHLTEKSLRPIACAQPFLLAATQGSLEYLRSYGFKTFGSIWSEDYDQIKDSQDRLQAIVKVMKEISSWPKDVREIKLAQARQIAEYNRCWFFSEDFFKLVDQELRNNLNSAFEELHRCNNFDYWYWWWSTALKKYPKVVEFIDTNQEKCFPTRKAVDSLLEICSTRLNQSKK